MPYYENIEEWDTLFYDEERAIFLDEDGFEVHNIYRYITPNELCIFLYKKEHMLIPKREGIYVELFYPESEEKND